MKQQLSNWRTLLHRWISGEANRTDERSLEALAQDDPFLADALEGYRSMPEADHARSVTRLKANLRKRNEKKDRAIVFYLKRIAAVGVVVLGAWFVFQTFDNSKENAMAFDERPNAAVESNEVAAVTDSSIVAETQSEKRFLKKEMKEEGQGSAGIVQLNDVIVENEEAAPPAVKLVPPTSPNVVAEIQPAPKEMAEPDKSTSAKDYVVGETKKKVASSAGQAPLTDGVKMDTNESEPAAKKAPSQQLQKVEAEPAPSSEMADDNMFFEQNEVADMATVPNASFLIKGQVTDANGEPLIGAGIVIKNTSQGAVTNTDGTFVLDSPIENPTLIMTYTGFKNQEVKAKSDEFLTVQLSDGGVQLNEVVVTGLSQKSQSKKVVFEPKGGFKKFEKYIGKNLHKPQAAIEADVTGEVEIGFTIDTSGAPTDFKTNRSLGHGCDEEAIRLLQEGPKWNGQPGSRYSYTFVFK